MLSDQERARYEWQLWTEGFGTAGQERLRAATVLVSRVGGVGGAVAQALAGAGVGRLVLAHAGELRPDDLNRQFLMSTAGLGRSRVQQAAQRLRDINPHVTVTAVDENIHSSNARRLVQDADLVACCAPRFEERLLLNEAAVAAGKPLVDSAMYDLEGQLLTVLPGHTPCLACLYPAPPPGWRREFPVFGAVAAALGSLAALEIIKCLTGLGETLAGQLLLCDLRDMSFRKARVQRNPDCPVCGQLQAS